jgi:hypothetical protein
MRLSSVNCLIVRQSHFSVVSLNVFLSESFHILFFVVSFAVRHKIFRYPLHDLPVGLKKDGDKVWSR